MVGSATIQIGRAGKPSGTSICPLKKRLPMAAGILKDGTAEILLCLEGMKELLIGETAFLPYRRARRFD